MRRLSWTENVTADVDDDRLVELFDEHVPGKVTELLIDYLVNNYSDDELKPIFTAIRIEDTTAVVDITDASDEGEV